MPLILGSERALFDRYIVEAELNVDEFEITKESDAPGDTQQMGTGTVTVAYTPPTSAAATRTPTEIVRHYRNGVVPPPHAEFERELKMNIFKTR